MANQQGFLRVHIRLPNSARSPGRWPQQRPPEIWQSSLGLWFSANIPGGQLDLPRKPLRFAGPYRLEQSYLPFYLERIYHGGVFQKKYPWHTDASDLGAE